MPQVPGPFGKGLKKSFLESKDQLTLKTRVRSQRSRVCAGRIYQRKKMHVQEPGSKNGSTLPGDYELTAAPTVSSVLSSGQLCIQLVTIHVDRIIYILMDFFKVYMGVERFLVTCLLREHKDTRWLPGEDRMRENGQDKIDFPRSVS